MSKNAAAAVIVAVVAAVLFGVAVWPTPYRYGSLSGGRRLIRTHRMTGEVQIWSLGRWKRMQ